MLTRKFDRADFDARALRADFESLGVRLNAEARDLRGRLHGLYYPKFGLLDGAMKRKTLHQFRVWEEYFRTHATQLFTHAREVEEKLVYSLAIESRPELKTITETLRIRRTTVDLLFRALTAKMRQAAGAAELEAEAIYDFCLTLEQIGLFFRFCAIGLYQPDPSKIVPGNHLAPFDLDWEALCRWAEALPEQMRPARALDTSLRQGAPPLSVLPTAEAAKTVEPVQNPLSLPAPLAARRGRRRDS